MPKCRKGKISENKAGRRYEKAGYDVRYRKKVDLIAKRGREKIAAEVKHGNKSRTIPASEVKKVAKRQSTSELNRPLSSLERQNLALTLEKLREDLELESRKSEGVS